jgi:hypothetical protein
METLWNFITERSRYIYKQLPLTGDGNKSILRLQFPCSGLTMPAKDRYHDAIKNALIKDGWIITADPYLIKYEDAELYADLAAEKPIAAERRGSKIVVEIKSFIGRSLMYDFHNALGQYIVYRNLIQLTEPEYKLYLGIDDLVCLWGIFSKEVDTGCYESK